MKKMIPMPDLKAVLTGFAGEECAAQNSWKSAREINVRLAVVVRGCVQWKENQTNLSVRRRPPKRPDLPTQFEFGPAHANALCVTSENQGICNFDWSISNARSKDFDWSKVSFLYSWFENFSFYLYEILRNGAHCTAQEVRYVHYIIVNSEVSILTLQFSVFSCQYLFIFWLFPENSQFSLFGEFVYFLTFPGKFQVFSFLRICVFFDFSRKIPSFQFFKNLCIFWLFPENS